MSVPLPVDFASRLQSMLGPAFDSFSRALQAEAPVSIRRHPLKQTTEKGTPIPWCTQGRYLDSRPVFTLDPAFHAGGYYVQEASSMFLEQALAQTAPDKPLRVLDLCAAPGGKSTHLMSLLHPGSLLVSNEVIRNRTGALTENIQKWGYDNVVVTSNDPGDFHRLPGYFDVIVTDAPCSGEGLFRKDPDAMHEWSPDNVRLCSQRQQRILHDVWPALKENGLLIYSTCTYEESENLDGLLSLRDTHEWESVPLTCPADWQVSMAEKQGLVGYQFFPHRVRGEGFFLSVIRKKEAPDMRRLAEKKTIMPGREVVKELSGWVKPDDSRSWVQHHDTVHMFSGILAEDWKVLQANLHVVYAGTAVATQMRNKLLPEHPFALSIHRSSVAFPMINLDDARALDYLRKNTLAVDATPGFALAAHDGLGLGWLNVLPNRANNLLPVQWRIRM